MIIVGIKLRIFIWFRRWSEVMEDDMFRLVQALERIADCLERIERDKL